LVGEPSNGDRVRISLEHAAQIPFTLVYKPHKFFPNYVWEVEEAHIRLVVVREEMQRLSARDIDPRWLDCYVDHNYPIVEGQVLFMTLVPEGNMHDWPRFFTDYPIASIHVL
jgi:hypothetical protein